ncbi:sialin-like isoform X2 [Antedon mediterranea]|uniref:sialin-like isoform X2 n=1 Tax=Antedon mediterranea TaxID=105859 RepID=UPI003AF6986E
MKRFLVAGMCSMIKLCLLCMRVNINIAIIEMVQTQNLTEEDASNVTLTTKVPTYVWDKETRQMILSGFFYGYTIAPVPGGWIACRLGGKRVNLFSLISSSILTALIPWSAGVSSNLLIVLRVLDGMAQGLNNAATVVLLGKWAVPHERSTLVSIAFFGLALAEVISNPLSAWICSAYNWPLSFYTYSIFGAVAAILWVVLIYETPEKDPFISSNEVEYLKGFDTGDGENKDKNISVPLLSIVKSSAVWAIVLVYLAYCFGFYFIITEAPTFISEIFGFDLKTTGWLMSILGIADCFFTLTSGVCADFIIRHKYLTIFQTRKLFAFLGTGLCAFLLICMDVFKHSAILSLITLILAFGTLGCNHSSIMPNILDITKHYSGVIIGIMTSVGSCSGFVGPTLIGALISNNIIGGIQLFGVTIFLLFAKAEEQFHHPNKENISKQEMKSYKAIEDN